MTRRNRCLLIVSLAGVGAVVAVALRHQVADRGTPEPIGTREATVDEPAWGSVLLNLTRNRTISRSTDGGAASAFFSPRISALALDSMPTATATVSPASDVTPIANYTPPSNAVPNSAKVTFCVVNAHYSQREPWTSVYPFDVFSSNLGNDFQQVLAAKGFTVRGPFGSYDEMTFPDKKNSDLVLQPDIDVRVSAANPRLSPVFFPMGNKVEADVIVQGRVTLSLRETLTGERMWYKTIELPPSAPVTCRTEHIYPVDQAVSKSETTPQVLLEDRGFSQPLGPVMEKYYKDIMQAAWNYLDPEEMAMVKKQSEEIRTRKVY